MFKPRHAKEFRDRVFAMHLAGKSRPEIARACGITSNAVSAILARHPGYAATKRVPPKKDPQQRPHRVTGSTLPPLPSQMRR